KGRYERLSFTRLHFGDAAVVKEIASNQLHVEVTHVEGAFAGLADDGKSVRHQVVQRLAFFGASLEFRSFGLKLFVGEGRDSRLAFVNRSDKGLDFLEF